MVVIMVYMLSLSVLNIVYFAIVLSIINRMRLSDIESNFKYPTLFILVSYPASSTQRNAGYQTIYPCVSVTCVPNLPPLSATVKPV